MYHMILEHVRKLKSDFSVLIVLSNSYKLWEIKKTAACSSTDIPLDLGEEQFFMLSALHQHRDTMKLLNIDHLWRFLLNWQICGADLNRILRIHAQWKEMLRKGKMGQKWSNKLWCEIQDPATHCSHDEKVWSWLVSLPSEGDQRITRGERQVVR